MLDQSHESEKIPDNGSCEKPFDDLDTYVTPPGFYRADHDEDEDGSDRPSGNSTVSERMAREEHSNNPYESTHASMAHASMARYAEAARNNKMNNNNRCR
ncbi:hypothetical protein [Priestia megaterium]|uniref:hypothetical protein n=1 Tax=Priestia megaterium TaxID=1404 RepID=UPI00101C579B|nr:hypothetical protein [Priestia megaterium]